MKLRKYKSIEDINSRTDGTGVVCGSMIYGENTTVHVADRFQKESSFNGSKWNQIIFSVTFEDIGLSMTIKSKDTSPKEGKYVQYAQDLLEETSREEFYKVALIIAKIHLQSTLHLSKEYLERDTKIIDSIDTTEDDLKYFKPYLNPVLE
jgi:hypothetical protein